MLEFPEQLSKYHLLTKDSAMKTVTFLFRLVFWVVASVLLYMDNNIL